jgi:hypothetical protein
MNQDCILCEEMCVAEYYLLKIKFYPLMKFKFVTASGPTYGIFRTSLDVNFKTILTDP